MALYQRDKAALSKGADSLAELLLGGRIKADQANQAVQLEQEQAAQDLAAANEARKGLPAGAAVHVGKASINTPDPLNMFFKQQAMVDKDDNQMRQETQALQGEYKKLSGFDPDKLKQLEDAKALLAQNNRMSYGQLQTALSRLKDKGALSDTDVARGLPRSLRRDAKGIAGYLGLGNGVDEDMLSADELKNVQTILDSAAANMAAQRDSGARELQGRAKYLAPTLSKKGQLDNAMKSMGVAVPSAPQAPNQQPPMSFEEFKAAKRAGKLK